MLPVYELGFGELCLKLLYYAMPAIPVNVLLCFQRKLYYAHIMLNYVMHFTFDPSHKPQVIN